MGKVGNVQACKGVGVLHSRSRTTMNGFFKYMAQGQRTKTERVRHHLVRNQKRIGKWVMQKLYNMKTRGGVNVFCTVGKPDLLGDGICAVVLKPILL